MAFWKWGVHFGGKGNPSHFTFMLDNGILIGTQRETPYQPGDLVAVTNGQGLLAIARVESIPRSILEKPEFAYVKRRYGIEYSANTIFADASWRKVLPIQQGAVEIHEIKYQAIIEMIWANLM